MDERPMEQITESQEQAEFDPDDPNLVAKMLANAEEKAWLESEVKKLQGVIKEDEQQRKGFLDQCQEIFRLFAMQVPTLPYPAEGVPGSHDPIMTRTVLQLVARGWDQIFPVSGGILHAKPVGEEDDEAADRVNDHMNWQVNEKIPNYKLGHLSALTVYYLVGNAWRAKWWDPTIKSTRFDTLTVDDVILPYSRKDSDPLMRDYPHVTRVRRYFRHRLEALGRAGFLHDVSRLFAKDVPQRPPMDDESEIEKESQERTGVEAPITYTDKRAAPRVLYEVNYWGVLPGEEEERPLKLIFDKWSSIPLALKVREEDDPLDVGRFNADKEAYRLQTENLTKEYQTALDSWNQMGGQMAGLPEPPQPELPPEPEPIRKRPQFDIIHYRCFDNPQSAYGLGIGHLLLHPTKYANGLQNWYMINAIVATTQGGLLPKGAMGKRGDIRVQPGKWTETELDPTEMVGVKPFNLPGPHESMWKLIKATKDDASAVVSDVDTMSGRPGPTNETATGAENRNNEARVLINNTIRFYLEAMREEPLMIASDNALFLDEREVFRVSEPSKEDPDQQMAVKKEVYRSDYANPFDITFTADQRAQSQPERIQAANNLIDRLNTSPFSKDMERGLPQYHAAFTMLYRAVGSDRMVASLGPAPEPPKPPEPPQPMSQADENQGFINEKYHPALPEDIHPEHVMELRILMGSTYWNEMTPTGKQMAEQHLREHLGFMYRTEVEQGGPIGLGAPGMAGEPGDAEAPGGPQEAPEGPAGEGGQGIPGPTPGDRPLPGGPPV